LTAYEFFAPAKIVFGWGRRTELGQLVRPLGGRALVVWGSRKLVAGGLGAWLAKTLAEAGVETLDLASIDHEPLVADVDAATARLRDLGARPGDFVLGIGGGSAIDLAKALAALATNPQSNTVRDFLEGVGRGLQIVTPPLPVAAMPTTAGTGSEATKNSVISSYEPAFKKSLRSDLMIPRLVLVDPELTISLPPATTAHTGLDAITQLVESYISRRARPIPQALALAALPPAMAALPIAVREGSNQPAREVMAHAALVSGMCLANSGLGMAHGVAAALGVHQRVAHGLACAVMLPATLEANRSVSEGRLAELGRALGWPAGNDAEAADFLCQQIRSLCRDLGVPARLSELGVRREQIPDLVRDSRGNSMSANPRDVPDAELQQILEGLL
jgi:alcohol dehydrogenase class IV